MIDLRIRRADPRDAATLSDLARRTFFDTFAAQNRPEDMEMYAAKSYGESQQRAELGNDSIVTLLAEAAGSAVAFTQMRTEGDHLFVERFYVDREWHGRGVAQEMMNAVEAHARALGLVAVRLAVWEHNPRAIAFYLKSGFRDIGSQPFLLGSDLQTDRVMEKRL